MAKCRSCGTDIPNGAEYCEACLTKLNTAKDSESYLDSLLNAVMAEEPERREIVYPKKETSSLVSIPEIMEEAPEPQDVSFDNAGLTEAEPLASGTEESGTERWGWDDFMQDFKGAKETGPVPEGDSAFEEPPTPAEEPMFEEPSAPMEEPVLEEIFEGAEEEEAFPMGDVFDTFFDGETELPDLKNYSIFEDIDEKAVDRMLAEELDETPWDTEEETPDSLAEFGDLSEFYAEESVEEEAEEVPVSEVGDIEDLFGMLEDERGADAPADIDITELPEVISAADLEDAADTFSGIVEASDEEEPVSGFGDFADLFGETEEPVTETAEESVSEFGDFADIFAGGVDVSQDTAPAGQSQSVDDFTDLFGGFGDDGGGLFEFGAEPIEMDDAEEDTASLGADLAEKAAVAKEEEAKEELFAGTERKGLGKLVTLFHKLFDNVEVDPSKIKKPPTKEELAEMKQKKKEAKERSKEEKEALLAEKKEQENQVKQEKQRVKKEAKAEKKAKKMEEAKLLLEEMESTRINRAGASIVFIFFGMIAVLIIVGTSIFSYSLSIRNAEYEFNRDEYTAAYNEIYGLEIKDEDILLYDRIVTVMYVQKQLNSYNNYYEMGDKPKALDSLLKGLQRYEKYIDLAVDLEVDTDLDSVRKKILEKVSSSFMMTEQEAMEIIQADSQVEYSKRVYDAVEALEAMEEATQPEE